MNTLVLAGFDSMPAAESAAHALIAEGFGDDAVNIYRLRQTPRRDNPAVIARRRAMPWRGAGSRPLSNATLLRAALLAAVGSAASVSASVLAGWGGPLIVYAAVLGAVLPALLASWRADASAAAPEGTAEAIERAVALVAVLAEGGRASYAAEVLQDAGGAEIARSSWRFLAATPWRQETARTPGRASAGGLSVH